MTWVIHQLLGQVNKFVPRRPLDVATPPPFRFPSVPSAVGKRRGDTMLSLPLSLSTWPLFLLPHHYFMQLCLRERSCAGGGRFRRRTEIRNGIQI